jgi:glycosyltransferase involved in cell wall biosynthesis
MKILFIACDYLPGSTRIATTMRPELARELVSRGHLVTVVTPDPDAESAFRISEMDGVTIWGFHSGPILDASRTRRAINEALLSRNAWKALRCEFNKHPHDFILFNSPSIFWGSLVNRLKKLWGVPSFLILRDIFPQWAIDNGLISAYSPITLFFRLFEWLNYRAADTIALQSPEGLRWFRQHKAESKHLEVVYNWAADDPALRGESRFRQELCLQDKVVFFYGGNIGVAQDMMNVLRLARRMLSEESAHFVLVGKGDEVELVKEAIGEYGLTNTTYLPPVLQDEFKRMLAEFDVGLFSLHRDHTTHNFPGKLLAYMVHAKPILGSINPGNDLRSVIDEAQAGLITINGDDEGLLSNALRLLYDPALRKRMGRNSEELLRKTFSVEAAANRILDAYEAQRVSAV